MPDRRHTGHHARGPPAPLSGHDAADGQAWVLPAADPLTAAERVQPAASHAGTAARVRATSSPGARPGRFVAPARELPDIWSLLAIRIGRAQQPGGWRSRARTGRRAYTTSCVGAVSSDLPSQSLQRRDDAVLPRCRERCQPAL